MEPYWFEVAIMATIFSVGQIFFGHFEEGVPKWRKFAKFLSMTSLAVLLSAQAGRVWFYAFLGFGAVFVVVVHAWWLPRHGIHPLTGEPRDRYYRLRGWEDERRP